MLSAVFRRLTFEGSLPEEGKLVERRIPTGEQLIEPDFLILGGRQLRIFHGISGEIAEVLQAYREQSLHRPEYRLPGCHDPCRYRGNAACAEGVRNKEKGQIPGTEGKGPAGGRKGPGRPEGLLARNLEFR